MELKEDNGSGKNIATKKKAMEGSLQASPEFNRSPISNNKSEEIELFADVREQSQGNIKTAEDLRNDSQGTGSHKVENTDEDPVNKNTKTGGSTDKILRFIIEKLRSPFSKNKQSEEIVLADKREQSLSTSSKKADDLRMVEQDQDLYKTSKQSKEIKVLADNREQSRSTCSKKAEEMIKVVQEQGLPKAIEQGHLRIDSHEMEVFADEQEQSQGNITTAEDTRRDSNLHTSIYKPVSTGWHMVKTSDENPVIKNTKRGSTEKLLTFIIERHGRDILIFAANKQCPLSQEVHALLKENVESSICITIMDVEFFTTIAKGFRDALMRITGNILPVVFYRNKYVGNYTDIVIAYDFKRVDLFLNPPPCELYHIVIIGGGPGAYSLIMELERLVKEFKIVKFGERMKIAVIDYSIPGRKNVCGMGSQSIKTRNLLWIGIREVQTSNRIARRMWGDDLFDIDEYNESATTMQEEMEKRNIRFHEAISALGIDYIRGSVLFTGNDTIEVNYINSLRNNNANTSDEEYTTCEKTVIGMNFILCGGTWPKISKFPGFHKCISIQQFLDMQEFPSSALIIGNTPEAFEAAYLISSYGGEVFVMNKYSQWLPCYDQGCVERCIQSFNNLGVKFMKISRIIFIQPVKAGFKVRVKLENYKHYTKIFARVLVDHRPAPISSLLNLEAAGVALEQGSRKIIVDKNYRSTSNRAVWAFGGIAKGHLDTIEFESAAGRRVIRTLLNEPEDFQTPQYFSRILLTPLEYAFVGETEKTAKIKHKNLVNVYESEVHFNSASGRRSIRPRFRIKAVCVDEWLQDIKVERVIGIHFLGTHAAKLILEYAALLEYGLSREEFDLALGIDSTRETGIFLTRKKLEPSDLSELSQREEEDYDSN